MNSYEKMVSLIRNEGSTYNPETIKLATMTSSNACKIGDLKLDSDDLLILDNISNLKNGDTVVIYRISEDYYIILGRVAR